MGDHRSSAAGSGRTVRAALADGDEVMAITPVGQYVLQGGTYAPRREDFVRVLRDVADNGQVAQIEPEDCRRLADWLAPTDASEFEEIRAAREDKLRQLLSDWRVRAESDNPSEYLDMSEMVDALAAILDGEG
jgi:hypothetical protein